MQPDSISSDNRIAIILSTYNGAKYVAEQLDSILKQSHTNWRCYIRDDGSSDNTLTIVKSYFANDSRFTFIDAIAGNMGLNASHYYLISVTTENYIAMCDQDDVWDTNKLEATLSKLKAIEGAQKNPALAHTNSVFVDSELNIIRDQFLNNRALAKGLNGILFANSVQGGSIIINKSLREIALKIPPVLPYDYHLAIIACLVGERVYIPQTLLKYRQHDKSSIATGDANKPNKLLKSGYSPSLLLSLHNYHHVKNDFPQITASEAAKRDLADYFYLFEGNSRIKKLMIYLKNRYPFYRKKDALAFMFLLIRNVNLKAIING